jgi:hypothetical protein
MIALPHGGGSMARYYFGIQNDRTFVDVDGLELSDMAEVRAEAIGFARDLMRLEPERRDWSRWVVRVTDESYAEKSVTV